MSEEDEAFDEEKQRLKACWAIARPEKLLFD
jgi:hypothetical protein